MGGCRTYCQCVIRNAELKLLPAESRLCLTYRVSELASGNVVRGQGNCVPLLGLGQSPRGVQRQSLWRVKGRALGKGEVI